MQRLSENGIKCGYYIKRSFVTILILRLIISIECSQFCGLLNDDRLVSSQFSLKHRQVRDLSALFEQERQDTDQSGQDVEAFKLSTHITALNQYQFNIPESERQNRTSQFSVNYNLDDQHQIERHESGDLSSRQSPTWQSSNTDRQSSRQGSTNSEPESNQNIVLTRVIEIAVFIDQALDNRFNGLSNGLVELNKLVLTIMNQVQHLFEYSSLQVPIKLKVVLIESLKESERQFGMSMPNSERGDIDAYLGNFCNWQHERLSREKRLWWDHAILLSGLDLYKATPGKNHSGVLGLAWVGGMCKGNYSCTINEASNFESAFVIAHEIGHSLGIMHDGQRNKCDPNTFIMSERTGAGKVHWSKCSNSYLNDSIARNQLKCMDNEQNGQIDSLYDLTKLRYPGQVYSINEQCKLAFGGNYSSFVTSQSPFNAVCRELWCVSGTWAKAAHPALEGSSCGDSGRVCREGRCVVMPPAQRMQS